MTVLMLAKPKTSNRSHELLVLPSKIKYGKPCSLGLWCHQYTLQDIFKIVQLLALEKADDYLYKHKELAVKFDNSKDENTHYIQIRSFLDIDKQEFQKTSLAFSIQCPDMDSMDIRAELAKFLHGEEQISDDDLKGLNLSYRKILGGKNGSK